MSVWDNLPREWRDGIGRVAATFLAAFVGILAGDGVDLLDVGVWRSAAAAGLTAVVTVVLVVIRRRLGTIT